MTDAREIIARHLCAMAAQAWSGTSPFERASYRTTASGMVDAVTSAGFRILGPDEIDGPTVEKCVVEMEVNWGHGCTPELRDAIRALQEGKE